MGSGCKWQGCRSVPRCVVLLLLGGTLQHFEAEPSKAVVSGPRAKPQRLTQLEAKVDGNRLKAKLELSQQLDQAIRQRDEAQAEECLEEALRQWLDISVVTFSPLIDQAAQEGDLQRAEKWFDRAQLFADKLDEVEFNSLVHAAAKQGNLSAAEAWFTKAQDARIQPDAITLTAVLRAASGRAERAREWYSAAPLLRISPNEVTHSCLLHALRDNATEVAEWFETMDDFQPNVVMFNTVIDAMARSGDMEAAERYFQRLCRLGRPDAATFGALINGAAKQGDVDGAKDWMEKMGEFGVPPNVVIWNAFLKAFRHRPAIEAEEMFRGMVQSRQQPDAITLVSLIGFLGKSRVKELCGELDVAYDRIIKQVVVNRDVKRADSHAQQSEQYRRLSRFSLRANRAKVHTPWHRLQLQQEMSKQRKSKDG